MRIGEINKGNYREFMNLFSQLSGGKIKFKDPLEGLYSKKQAVTGGPGSFDENGEIINSQGVSGMCIHGKDPAQYRQIIGVSEAGKEELFDMVKSEFIDNYGILNGDTTRKSEVFAKYQKSIPKGDRLMATWTLGELEQEYREGLIDAVKQANPNWKIGDKFDTSILDTVTRESVSGIIDQQSRMGINLQA